MASNSSNALQVASSSDQVTAPARSLNRQTVLEEDEYTEALSRIIARDFFPSLVHLEASNDYLDALRSEDTALINASVRRLSRLQATPTPGHPSDDFLTPRGRTGLETPLPERRSKRRRVGDNMSLDEFQAKYTSEDNSSFTEILDEENKQRRERWNWAWDAQHRVEEAKAKQLEARERLLIEPSAAPGVREQLAIEMPQVAGLLTEKDDTRAQEPDPTDSDQEMTELGEDESKAMILLGTGRYGDSESSTKDPLAKRKDDRPAGVDGWTFRARNNLMFPPDADQSPYTQTGGGPVLKTMKHHNTRLPDGDDEHSHEMEPPTPSRSLIGAAIAGTPYRSRSPDIAGYSLVPDLPSPTPNQLGPSGMKKLMTVGQVISTPRVLSGADNEETTIAPDTPFHIPKPSPREAMAHRLASSASQSLKARAALIGQTSRRKHAMDPPSVTPRRLPSDLTPAARRLLDRTVGSSVATNRRGDAMNQLAGWERKSGGEQKIPKLPWTPTPKR